MKKKVISILMAGIIAASLAACGSGGSGSFYGTDKSEKTEAATVEARSRGRKSPQHPVLE